jgi:hypothetical protein
LFVCFIVCMCVLIYGYVGTLAYMNIYIYVIVYV